MTLIKKLVKKEKKECLSYDNLLGNYQDGGIGIKIKKEILDAFIEKKNPQRDF
jgi:hypothetical protein